MAGRRRGFDRAIVLVLAALVLGLAACSPESARTRGGGAGADPGNREGEVELTGDEDRDRAISHNTPDRLPSAEEPPAE